MLAPSQSIFDNDNIVDPKRLGQHNNRDSEQVGLTYSSQYGFLDLGHIRDMCDMTKWIYDHIVTTGGAPTTVRMIEGDAKIHTRIPRNLWELASRAIANDEGLAHEISSYEVFSAGGHNSSFSPEDLSSNNFGTRVAVIAIARKQPFNNAVTEVLAAELAAAGAVSKADTLKAFNAINGCWVNFRRVTDLLGDTYLQRRNFSAWPWKVPGMPNAPTPSWVGDSFATVEAFYSYTTKKGLLKIAFPKEIARIKSDARGRYGSDFDKPDCALPQPPRPRPQTCEQCAEEFNRCIRFSTFPEQCLANRSACLGRCSRR